MPAAKFRLTSRQRLANEVLKSDARHCLLYGGARSGKTFLIIRAIVVRAMLHRSRHAVLRFRFNHVKTAIVHDTLPKVMETCWPEVAPFCKLDKSDWFYQFPNRSEIWFGGLDDKERTEKILGQEYATLFLNECSQIPWASRNIAITRLAQNTPLRLKAYYDCNPPSEAHWTYRVFQQKRHPDQPGGLKDPENYASFLINPKDNLENLKAEYLEELEQMPERHRRRFLLGQFSSAAESALWTPELLDQSRFATGELPEMQRVLIAVDPSGCSGPEDTRSDEIGIIVVGLGVDGKGYVLEDLSGRHGPAEWGLKVAGAFQRHSADCVVAESNYGGAMVAEIIRSANPSIPVRQVTASRGKVVRAEPVAALFEQQKVYLAGHFPALEDQLCGLTTAGYVGSKSPDRADAMVWGLAYLFPAMTRKEPWSQGGMVYRASMPQVHVGYPQVKRYHRR